MCIRNIIIFNNVIMLNTSGTIMHTMGSVIISTLILVLSSYRVVQNVDRQILAILVSVCNLIQYIISNC